MKRTFWAIPASVLATALTGGAALAQGASMGEERVELYAEMLAMGDVCETLTYGVRRDALADFVASRLNQGSEDDIDEVLGRRDAKLADLHEESEQLRAMRRGDRRQELTDEYMSQIATRCRRMARNDTSKAFFVHASGD